MKEKPEIQQIILIADLSGYTALTEAHGNISAARIVKRYVEMVQECLLEDSRLIEAVGDEVLIAGSDALNLIEVGLNLREKVENEPNFPAVHIGIHAGYVLEQDGKYFGSAINVAARTAAYARAGQILCTGVVVEFIDDKVTIRYRPLGEANFKNVVEPVSLFEIESESFTQPSSLIDPVCHMRVKPDSAHGRLNYQGRNYFFCSFECAKTFANRPEHYTK